MNDEFLEKTVEALEKQLSPPKNTKISLIKKKTTKPIIKDISGKIESAIENSQIVSPPESKPEESEVRKPKKVVWL